MKNFNKISVLIILLVFPVLLMSQDLVILHSNDTHSNIEPMSSGRNKGMGGVQRRANYISQIRKEYKNVLLLDAGDYNQGTPYFTLFKGDVEIKLNNNLRYDAACLGNHEFDNGQQELARRLKKANYVTLCANYNMSATPLRGLVKPYTIILKGGKKIGIIGVLTDLNGMVSAPARENMIYMNPIPIVDSLAAILKFDKKCDVIICLSHLGFDGGSPKNPSDTELALSTKNIDIIIGGHSHTFLEKPVIMKNTEGKDVIVTTTGAYGVYTGRIDISF